MLKALAEERTARERQLGIEERTEIEVRRDAAFAHERRALFEHRRFCGIATDRRDQRELIERLVERDP
ncbi:MAG TPA: hypothetical protein VFI56_25275 [Vicinamibacterales bacterium]|nr:hypothetical protein [Vicinamibacterales bacterium]